MALLHSCRALRALHPAGTRLLGSTPSVLGTTDKAYKDMQDPSKTHPAYAGAEKSPDRTPPSSAEDNAEKEVKWGVNVPASAEQWKEELKGAAEGLADSVKMGASVLAHKATEKVDAAKRAVGMEAGGPDMGSEGTMGAAGKMEYAPPGSKTGYPTQPEVAHAQSATPDQQARINEEIAREMREQRSQGGGAGAVMQENLHDKGP
eukprot:scaffold3.g6517.t1